MASITEHNGQWRAHVYVKGKRKSAVWPTKREAMAWAVRVEAELASKKPTDHSFSDLCDEYLKRVVPSKAGAVWESRRIEVMREHFGPLELAHMDSPHISKWRDWRMGCVSPSSVVREANLLKHMLSVARDEWRWLDHDPFRGVKLPKENPPRKARWTWQLIRKVLRHAQAGGPKMQEVGAAFHISLRTGMRLQEVLAAPAAFDTAKRVVTVRTKTHKHGDDIPIGRIAAKLLDRPAFVVQPNEASTLFRKMTRQLLIDGLTFHDARATALTLLSKKVDVLTLARVSRHKDLRILMNTYYRATAAEIARRL